jgi:hypothetical protein
VPLIDCLNQGYRDCPEKKSNHRHASSAAKYRFEGRAVRFVITAIESFFRLHNRDATLILILVPAPSSLKPRFHSKD